MKRTMLAVLALIALVAAPVHAASTTKIFTAVGVGPSVLFYPGDTFSYSVSGTFSGTVSVESSVDGTNYVPSAVTATAAKNGQLANGTSHNALYRFRCSVYTSGSIVTSLTPNDDVVQVFKNNHGVPIFQLNNNSVQVLGDINVTGNISGTSSSTTVIGNADFLSSVTAHSGLYVRGAGAIGSDPAPQGGTPPAIFANGNIVAIDNNPADHYLLEVGTSTTSSFGTAITTSGILAVKSFDPSGLVAEFGSTEEATGGNGIVLISKSPDPAFLAFSTTTDHFGQPAHANYGAGLDYEQDGGFYRLLMSGGDNWFTFATRKTLGINVTAGNAEVRNMPLLVDGDITTKGDVNTRFTRYEPSINQILTSTNIGVTGLGSFISIQDSTNPAVQKGFDLIGYDPDSGGMLWTGQQNHGTNIPPAWNFTLLDQASGLYLPNAIHIDTMTFHYRPSPSAPPVWHADNAGNTFQNSTATAAEFILPTGDAFTAAPNPNVGSSDGAIIVGGIKGVAAVAAAISYSGVCLAGGSDLNGYVSNSGLGAGGGIYDPTRGSYHGHAALSAGVVMQAYDHTHLGRVGDIGTANVYGGITDGGGASVNIIAGFSGGYNANGQLAPGGNGHINLVTGDNLGGDSTSNPTISTRTTNGGETLTFSINGEAPRTITLAGNANAAAICSDIQAKVRALTAANPDNQYAYSGFNAQPWVNNLNALALVAPGDAVGAFNGTVAGPTSLVITGGTFAPLAGLGLANGGAEASGSIGTYDFALGQGLVPGSVEAMQIDLTGTHVRTGGLSVDGGIVTSLDGGEIVTDGNGSLVASASMTVVGLIHVGWEHITQSCGAGVTTCTATCSAGKYASGGGCTSAAVLGVAVLLGDTGNNFSHTCTTVAATTLSADVYCSRIAP